MYKYSNLLIEKLEILNLKQKHLYWLSFESKKPFLLKETAF